MNTIFCLLVSIFFNTSSHFFFKKGVVTATSSGLLLQKKEVIKKYMTQPALWIGLLLNGFAAFFWLIALSLVDLSYAFPFLSLNYIFIPLGAVILFQERLSPARIAGICVICIGLFLIAVS